EGRAAVYAYIEDVKTVTKINVSKRPELIGAYNSVKGLGVKFKASEVADRYVIYRKYKSDWTKIDTVMANSSSLTISGDTIMYYDTSAKNNYGGGYIYSVAAQRGKNCATSYDKRGVAIYRLLEPTISKASAVGNGKVKLTWSKVPAMGYEVQYQENGTTGWKKCPQTTVTSQTISGLKKGKTYQFHIRCYKTNSSRGTFYSAYSKSVSVKVK
ncbi:MAG: fibronectin type III domain-containing protein, partial [Eubacteriales bacterium]|nr:fibronectin type III domain-containing protein [Eubacteriales bacterium]